MTKMCTAWIVQHGRHAVYAKIYIFQNIFFYGVEGNPFDAYHGLFPKNSFKILAAFHKNVRNYFIYTPTEDK